MFYSIFFAIFQHSYQSLAFGSPAGNCRSILSFSEIIISFPNFLILKWFANYVKNVQIRSFFWSVFSRIWTGNGDLLGNSPYSVRIRENLDQKISVFGHFHTVSNSSIYLLVITIQFRFACGDILLNREKVQKYFDHDCGFYYHSFITPSLVRNCVSFKIVSRENDAITPDIIVAQNESMLLVLLINYSLSNIYNADKFVFFSFYRTTFIS